MTDYYAARIIATRQPSRRRPDGAGSRLMVTEHHSGVSEVFREPPRLSRLGSRLSEGFSSVLAPGRRGLYGAASAAACSSAASSSACSFSLTAANVASCFWRLSTRRFLAASCWRRRAAATARAANGVAACATSSAAFWPVSSRKLPFGPCTGQSSGSFGRPTALRRGRAAACSTGAAAAAAGAAGAAGAAAAAASAASASTST